MDLHRTASRALRLLEMEIDQSVDAPGDNSAGKLEDKQRQALLLCVKSALGDDRQVEGLTRMVKSAKKRVDPASLAHSFIDSLWDCDSLLEAGRAAVEELMGEIKEGMETGWMTHLERALQAKWSEEFEENFVEALLELALDKKEKPPGELKEYEEELRKWYEDELRKCLDELKKPGRKTFNTIITENQHKCWNKSEHTLQQLFSEEALERITEVCEKMRSETQGPLMQLKTALEEVIPHIQIAKTHTKNMSIALQGAYGYHQMLRLDLPETITECNKSMRGECEFCAIWNKCCDECCTETRDPLELLNLGFDGISAKVSAEITDLMWTVQKSDAKAQLENVLKRDQDEYEKLLEWQKQNPPHASQTQNPARCYTCWKKTHTNTHTHTKTAPMTSSAQDGVGEGMCVAHLSKAQESCKDILSKRDAMALSENHQRLIHEELQKAHEELQKALGKVAVWEPAIRLAAGRWEVVDENVTIGESPTYQQQGPRSVKPVDYTFKVNGLPSPFWVVDSSCGAKQLVSIELELSQPLKEPPNEPPNIRKLTFKPDLDNNPAKDFSLPSVESQLSIQMTLRFDSGDPMTFKDDCDIQKLKQDSPIDLKLCNVTPFDEQKRINFIISALEAAALQQFESPSVERIGTENFCITVVSASAKSESLPFKQGDLETFLRDRGLFVKGDWKRGVVDTIKGTAKEFKKWAVGKVAKVMGMFGYGGGESEAATEFFIHKVTE